MIAQQHGIDASTAHCSFLMGFTYGAVAIPGHVGISPFTDPEPGFVFAAPYLGLKRRFYVTNDPAAYTRALRVYLAHGIAVRVALDAGVLYGLGRQLPHSDLLVGYDVEGFWYYETVCLPGVACQPGRRPPGAPGLYVPVTALLEATQAQSRTFGYPWRYGLTLYAQRPKVEDMAAVWRRNGNALIGGARYGPRQGADAIDQLATRASKRGASLPVSDIRWGLQAAVFTRRDNAAYLRSTHARDDDLLHAAMLFERARAAYQEALERFDTGLASRAAVERTAACLHDAARAEREAGNILRARGAASEG